MTPPNLRNGALATLLAAGVLALTFFAPNLTARGEPSVQVTPISATEANWRVIDGDTFEDLDTGDRYRLENIDTPETGRAPDVARSVSWTTRLRGKRASSSPTPAASTCVAPGASTATTASSHSSRSTAATSAR